MKKTPRKRPSHPNVNATPKNAIAWSEPEILKVKETSRSDEDGNRAYDARELCRHMKAMIERLRYLETSRPEEVISAADTMNNLIEQYKSLRSL